jgi:RNA polymerase sigma factor (sigma-70 family)
LTHAELRVMRSGPVPADDPYLSSARPDYLPYKRVYEAHDAQTRALIGQYAAMARFPHSETVVDRLEHWRWLDTMAGPEDKHRFLEPLIAAVQRDPAEHEDKLIFLLIVCEPVRRKVSKAFVRARQGLDTPESTSLPASWHRREESRRLMEVEKQTLFDVTRSSLLDALYAYPVGGVERFFPWLRATIAHGALDHLRHELPTIRTNERNWAEAEALQLALHGLEELAAPASRDVPGRRAWRATISLRSVFDVAESYFEHATVRNICASAVGRLPVRQSEVITALFFEGQRPDELAQRRSVSRSTVDNHKAQALRNLHADEVLFTGLYELGRVRDRARMAEINARYPDGRLPDGRRIVVIDEAA